ncbi:MAG: AsmA family protein, partial [Hyphomicrobium sp.]|nr:AsmA family protein [Hyphomicrobium sp.]
LAAPLLFGDRYSRLTLQSGAVFAASNNSYSLSAPVRLMTGPTIDLEGGTLSVPPSRTGLARGGQMIAMLITGSGPQMTLEKAIFTADFSAREPTFSQDSGPGDLAPLVKALQRMQFDGLIVRDSTVRIKMSDGSIVDIEDVNATITSKPNGGVHAVGSINFRGERLNFETTLGASLDAQGMSRPISASFVGAPLTATLEGRLMLGEGPQLLSPQAELSSDDLRVTARWLGVKWPAGRGFGAFHAKGQLEWVGRTVAFQDATIELDENDASGTLSVNFGGARPTVEATLGLKTLDLSRYLKSADPNAKASNLLARVRTASGLEVPLIQAIDADFRISSDSVVLPDLNIGRSAATVSLRNGKLLADLAELEIDDGTRGGGQIRIDMSGANPVYSVQAKFEAADVGRSIEATFGHPTVQGRGLVTVDLTAAGNTGETLLRSLDGKLGVVLAEGGRIGLDVNKLADANEPPAADLWKDVSARAISVDRLEARFIVTQGIVRTQSAEAVSGERALTAVGAVSLLDRLIDMELAVGDIAKAQPSVAPDAPAPATVGSLKLRKREIIKVHGPWSAPAIRSGPAADEVHKFGPPNPG